ncbi:MAG: sulfatase-like hydrolase/transferase [Caldilineaceae bacterium]
MQPQNFLFILSDQHSYDALGCYGHPLVQTPHLDRLAQRGTRFTNAYTPCPICVPARAALATGRYVHQIGNWDNGHPYEGAIPSWHHRLREQGFRVDSIGKLHFRRDEDDLGFSQCIEPLNVVDGVGDILSCIREDPPLRAKRSGILGAGPGDSTYLQYDQRNADNGVRWLRDHAADDKPWALFLSFVCPHPPYIAPPELYERYPLDQISMPPQWRTADWPDHPAMRYFRRFFGFAPQFEEAEIRRMNAAYYGACTWLDQQIGRVLSALEALNLTDGTRIIYSSDHGEHRGSRGIYGKFTMYEESVGIPFIAAGPDVPAGKVVNTPVSLLDIFPTALGCVGASAAETDADLPGESIWQIANAPDRERFVLSEYHAVAAQNGYFMLTNGHHKYVYYVNAAPQLFDLHADPHELHDLAASPAHAAIRTRFEQELRALLDPEAVDARAKADQHAKIETFGGEEAVLRRGFFVNSPTPGEDPGFQAV